MSGCLDKQGNYYEGDLQPGDVQIDKRPSIFHDLSGMQWVLNVERAKAAQLAIINAKCERAISAISDTYPESEVKSWPKQENEARALVADSQTETTLLSAMATERGITREELASRVIAKADAFAEISGVLIGKRQRLEDQLSALGSEATLADIAAITWEEGESNA